MASRNDYSQNRKLYVGTTAEVSVGDGNAIVTGSLGIGTTSPDLKLDVTHATAGEYVATFQNTGANLELKLGVTSTSYLNIQGQAISNSAAFNMSLQADGGNVGIGTTTPTTKLQVAGIVQINESGETAFYEGNGVRVFATQNYRFRNAGGGVRAIIDVNSTGVTAGNLSLYNASNVITSYINNAGDSYFNGGKVGINTTTPNTALQVNQATTVPLLIHRPSNTNFDPHGIGFSTRNDAVNGGLGDVRSGIFSDYNGDLFLAASQSSITTNPLASSRLFIEGSNGHVGIGTTSPSQKLHVHSTSGDALVRVSGDNILNSGGEIKGFNNGFGFNVAPSGGGTYVERMRINGLGNVGIGDPSPTSISANTFSLSVNSSRNDLSGALIAKANGTIKHQQYWDSSGYSFNLSAGKFQFIGGNVGIGTTAPNEKLEVNGNSITRGKTRGLATNYATSEGWVAAGASTFTSRVGYFGGNFGAIGATAENKVEYGFGPFGAEELIWMTVAETASNDDGGWNKSVDGFANTANNGFMSVVYMRRDSGTPSGNFYHGCLGSATNNLDGTANSNPYFCAFGISILPADVWCVSIGIIYAADDASTATSALGGSYRLDTGAKIHNAPTYRQKSGNSTQQQRVYHYYSTSPSAQLDFARPGWYVVDGTEPTLSEITAGAAGGDDVYWSALGNNIYNDNSGNVGIGTATPDYKLEVQGAISSADAGLQKATFANVGNDLVLTANADATNVTAKMLFKSSGTGGGSVSEKMSIQGDGSVIIGSSAVGGNKTLRLLSASNAVNYDIDFQQDGTTNHGRIRYTEGASDLEFFPITGVAANLVLKFNGNSYFQRGNVGIGITLPSEKLDTPNIAIGGSTIAGYTANKLRIDNNGGTSRFYSTGANTTTKGQYVFHVTSSDGSLNPEIIRINSAGNVGIGVTGPLQKLVVQDGDGGGTGGSGIDSRTKLLINANTEAYLSFNVPALSFTGERYMIAGTTKASVELWDYAADPQFRISSVDSRPLTFATTNVEKMRISPGGSVKFNAYDSTNNTGTPTYILGTDASGNVLKTLSFNPPTGTTQFFNQSSSYNNFTPGITGYGDISMDTSVSYYDTGINVSTGTRGMVWTGKHYIITDYANLTAKFYDNNFIQITNPQASSISIPAASGTGGNPHGAGWDGRYLYTLNYSPLRITAYDLDNGTTTATIVNVVTPSNTTTTYDIEYAEGHLYTCADGKVSKYKVEGKNITHVFTSANILSSIEAQAITYDGSYLWFTQNGASAFKVSLDCVLVATISTGLPPNNVAWAWNGQNIAAVNHSTGDVYVINTAATRFDTEQFLMMGGKVGINMTNTGNASLNINGNLLLDSNAEIQYSLTSGGPYLNVRSRDSATSACGIRIKSPYGNPGFFYGEGTGSGTSSYIGILDGAGQWALQCRTGISTFLSVNNSIRLFINNSGNVGIGTTTPASKLEVSGRISGGELGSSDVCRNGLLFYVDFNDKACISGTSGTEVPVDLGPQNLQMSLVGGANFEYKDGIGCYYFDGSNDHILVENYVVADTVNSYEIWHYAVAQSTYETWWDSGTERPLLGTYNDDLIAYPAYNTTSLGDPINPGKWYHVVWAMNGNTDMDIFVNGKRTHEGLTGNMQQRTGTFSAMLGGDTSAETTNGFIAITRTYSRQLTPADVLQNYNAEVERFAPVTPSLGIVQSYGNVGIGTNSPRVSLQVNGTNASVGVIGTPKNDWYTTAYNGIQIGDGTTLWGRAGDTHLSGNYYVKDNSGSAQDTYINALSALDFWLDSSSGSLKYRNAGLGGAGNAISFTTRFVVLSNGNFGIGTTNPGNLLDVAGDTDISGQLFVTHDANYVAKIKQTATSMSNASYTFEIDSTSHTSNMSTAGAMSVDVNGGRAFTITGSGLVGIGTNSPSSKLTVIGTGNYGTIKITNSVAANANKQTGICSLNYIGNSTSIFQYATNSGANTVYYGSADGSFRGITQHSFYVSSGANTVSHSLGMQITSGQVIVPGNMGIGNTLPQHKLDVSGTIRATNYRLAGNTSNPTTTAATIYDQAAVGLTLSAHNTSFRSYNGSAMVESARLTYDKLVVVGDVIAYGSPSDKRLKENIKPIESALDKAMKLQGVTFDWKKSDSILDIKEDIGFIAQDVQKIVPELVRENEDGMLSMRHQGIAPILLEAIKELKAEIEELKKQIK